MTLSLRDASFYTSPINNASVYTELGGLQAINRLGRENPEEGLRQVAMQFESMFLSMMLKGMRAGEEALFSDNYLRSNEMKFHRENFDNQLALHMATTGGVGLADALHRQLMHSYQPTRSGISDLGMYEEVSDLEPQKQEAKSDSGSGSGSGSGAEQIGDLTSARLFTGETTRVAAPGWRVRSLGESQTVAARADITGPHRPLISERVSEVPVVSAPVRFDSPESFVQHLMPIAQKYAPELGVDPKVLLAQSALETGWGQKMIRGANGKASFNLFGIKASDAWHGAQVSVSTLEFREGAMQRETASFRAYNSYEESFADYVRLMQNQPRYASALQHAGDSSAYTDKLQQAGYATDPDYAEKIRSVMRSPSLSQASLDGAAASRVN